MMRMCQDTPQRPLTLWLANGNLLVAGLAVMNKVGDGPRPSRSAPPATDTETLTSRLPSPGLPLPSASDAMHGHAAVSSVKADSKHVVTEMLDSSSLRGKRVKGGAAWFLEVHLWLDRDVK